VADPELVASVYTILLNEETARQRESTLAADLGDDRETIGAMSAGRVEDLRWRRMLEGWVVQAYENNASDIHIEHRTDALVVRMRMDGVLTVVDRLDVSNAHRIINVAKTMSRMDIAERRRPQDGRMTVATPAGARVALRVSSFPVGDDREKLAMRIVREYAGFDSIASLGLSPASHERLNRLFSYRDGIVIITGPPGSGKTTTLYSALLQITDETVNTVTIEDPIEADIGLNQSQVVPGVYAMADALRSFLRGDPDFIMVGEIRDEDTASLAVEASLVGRLVVSSMHVSRASDAVERFVSLGVEPRLIANGLRGVANQRLLRRLCEHCRVPANPARLRDIDDWPSEPTLFDWNPAGCSICFHTGWKGRIPVAEVALFDNDELREAVASRSTSVEIERLARANGMTPLWDECIARVADGQTTLAEVNRAGLYDRELR
jgi:type IV pilus assembly protein PilB